MDNFDVFFIKSNFNANPQKNNYPFSISTLLNSARNRAGSKQSRNCSIINTKDFGTRLTCWFFCIISGIKKVVQISTVPEQQWLIVRRGDVAGLGRVIRRLFNFQQVSSAS
jgi:hypothetical protein